ncbi:hypothetical protein IQ268_20690 [Oculatella sp. LEGE 06141]|uniref:hypothetical protein n=1 Tax=Oculatella sp. LEGE 06141 TaxID=1828648 RepID=UPI001881B803|nr:hypothetical protein [Oculatella sp. LEGE 06141]MBE9180980.1 hypothetical protein [Oculatella sp. LEGE 06141]
MNLQDRLHPEVAESHRFKRSNFWNGVLLFVLGTFAAGLIPILYSSAASQQEAPANVGESSLWGAFGER